MNDVDWVIHLLNRLDRYTEDVRVNAVRAREAAVSAKRAGWYGPDADRAITSEIRKDLEDSLTDRKLVSSLVGLAYLLEETNRLLEEANCRGEPVPREAVRALETKFKEMSEGE